MKVTREFLKGLIKECLVEILRDGISESAAPLAEAARRPVQQQQRQASRQNTQQQRPQQQPRMNNPLAMAVKQSAGGNAVMESILADTAMTTLQQQIQADGMSRPNVPAAAYAADEPDIAALQEAANKDGDSPWAALAFDTPKPDATSLLAMGFKP
jgi:hypothetical protein